MLLCKNVVVNGRRTSMRLDEKSWFSLSDICKKENISLQTLCSLIDNSKGKSNLESASKLFILSYFCHS